MLVGVDAASIYCYLLQGVDHRDEDTWGWHLLDVMAQGFYPDYTRLPMTVAICELGLQTALNDLPNLAYQLGFEAIGDFLP